MPDPGPRRGGVALVLLIALDCVIREVAEAREFAVEMKLHGADRAVTLLGDDAFGDVVGVFETLDPVLVPLGEFVGAFLRPLRGLFALEPESGMSRLSREDAALCPAGPMGTRLSWVVARAAGELHG